MECYHGPCQALRPTVSHHAPSERPRDERATGELGERRARDDTLHWVAKGDALDFALEKDVLSSALSRIAAALNVRGTAEPSGQQAAAPPPGEPREPAELEALTSGLERLGFKRDEARERLIDAHTRLSEGGKTPSQEDVVREALRRSVPRIARSTRPVPAA